MTKKSILEKEIKELVEKEIECRIRANRLLNIWITHYNHESTHCCICHKSYCTERGVFKHVTKCREEYSKYI